MRVSRLRSAPQLGYRLHGGLAFTREHNFGYYFGYRTRAALVRFLGEAISGETVVGRVACFSTIFSLRNSCVAGVGSVGYTL